MGNNFCKGVDTVSVEGQKEVDLNVYSNMFVRNKIKTQSSRLDQIYSIKHADNKEEFILSLKPYNNLEAEDSVSVTLINKQSDSLSAFYLENSQSYKFQIEEHVVRDMNQDNEMLTRVQDQNTNERYSIKTINFDDIQDMQFKEGIYEIAIHNKLKNAHDGEDHPNILQLKDSYILHNKERLVGKKCLVLVYEYFDATLSEIILFRKENEWKYSDKQMCSVLRELASSLHLMHHLGISHRDIRPCTIYYVSNDKSFKFGSFSEAKLQENYQLIRQIQNTRRAQDPHLDQGMERLNTVRGVPEFLSPEILDNLHLNSIQKVLNYDPFKLDVYCLGLVMVLAKRQQIKLDIDTLENKIKVSKHSKVSVDFSNWTLGGIVKDMVKIDPHDRISAHEVHMRCQKDFPGEEFQKPIECQLVQSLRYKKQKENKEQYLNDQSLIAKQYYKLYDMEMWLYKQSEILEDFVHNDQEIKKADIQFEIAEGYLQHSDLTRAKEYYEKAAYIYNSLGHEFTQKSNLEPAINYYNKAIDCVRKASNGQETAEQALLLENIGNAYRMKGELQKARAFQEEALLLISQIKGEVSIEVARILNNIGNVYAQLGFLKKADKRLKRALRISEQIYLDQEEKLQLQALCMSNLGEVHRLKGNLEKAKKCLEEALQIRENILGSGHIQVADTVENLGNVEFDLGNYHKARKYYERSLVIKRSKMQPDNPEIALTLNNIGNVCKNMEEFEKAKKMYEDALFILTQKFGNDAQHPYMAISFGNIAIIYLDQNQTEKGYGFLNKALDILEQTVGYEHPDYQFYAAYLNQNNQSYQNQQYQQQPFQQQQQPQQQRQQQFSQINQRNQAPRFNQSPFQETPSNWMNYSPSEY